VSWIPINAPSTHRLHRLDQHYYTPCYIHYPQEEEGQLAPPSQTVGSAVRHVLGAWARVKSRTSKGTLYFLHVNRIVAKIPRTLLHMPFHLSSTATLSPYNHGLAGRISFPAYTQMMARIFVIRHNDNTIADPPCKQT